MSEFLHSRYRALSPYVPGEQPRDRSYIKLNTNESPFPPSDGVLSVINRQAVSDLRLYSDPEALVLKEALASEYGVGRENVFVSNGSDEALYFAFMAFSEDGIAFPDITYGFYRVFADLLHIPAKLVPLREDFTIQPGEYEDIHMAVVIANPNAPTGILLSTDEVERIAASNPEHVIIVDEAYIDFAGTGASCVPLIGKYRNLLVVQTFSKSRSLAGARVGYAIGDEALIRDLETLKFSVNPYNVNRLSMAAAAAAVRDRDYYQETSSWIVENRDFTEQGLRRMGFEVLPSKANFVFARTTRMDGAGLYHGLKERGILIRHFDSERIREYNRITIGSRENMERLLAAIEALLA